MANATLPEHEAAADEFGRTWADLAETLELRRRLAESEIRSDLATGKRLGIVAGVGLVLALTALPLLVAAVAWIVATITNVSFAVWLLVFGGPLLTLGLTTIYSAWRKFRREFLALSATRQELHEDLIWLRELLGTRT